MIPNFLFTVKNDCSVIYKYLLGSYDPFKENSISNKIKNKVSETCHGRIPKEFHELAAQRAVIRLSGAATITYSLYIFKDVLLNSVTRPLDYMIISVALYIVGHDVFVFGINLEKHRLELDSGVARAVIRAGCGDMVINRSLEGMYTHSIVNFINNLIKV